MKISGIVFAALVFTSTQSMAGELNESLDFNNNAVPVGWSLNFSNSGNNAGITNQRFEVGQVDTTASLLKNVALPAGTNSLEFRYTASIADDFSGMGSSIDVYDSAGNKWATGLGHGGFGATGVRLGVGYQPVAGQGIGFLTDPDGVFPPNWGVYSVVAKFSDGELHLRATKQGAAIPIFDEPVAMPGFDINQITKIGVSGFVTSGEPLWIDDVKIKSTGATSAVPLPSSLYAGSAMLLFCFAWQYGRKQFATR